MDWSPRWPWTRGGARGAAVAKTHDGFIGLVVMNGARGSRDEIAAVRTRANGQVSRALRAAALLERAAEGRLPLGQLVVVEAVGGGGGQHRRGGAHSQHQRRGTGWVGGEGGGGTSEVRRVCACGRP
eukprot:SAG31_NODE_56_length_29726_cov_41.443312_17_plen_127_part_00